MSKKKEKLLKKYLEKKRKQRKRDVLLAQIAEIDRKKKELIKSDANNDHENLKEYHQKENSSINLDEKDQRNDFCEDELSSSKDNISFTYEKASKNKDLINDKETDLNFSLDKMKEHNLQVDSLEEVEIEDKYKSTETSFNSSSTLTSEINDSKEDNTLESEDINIDSFLGETKIWKNVACKNRIEEVQKKRMELPIFYEQSEIISQIRKNDIVLIKGETGCGKTTQIPQFLYEGGFSGDGIIGVTQPRRISAISITHRINEEMNDKICGYTIRYDSTVKNDTKIKIMTDGILIKEIQEDFLLNKYSVILLDEIHERSKNVDILISLLSRITKIRKLQGKRLKIVLMSACDMLKEINSFFDNVVCLNIPSQSHKVSIFYEQKTPEDYIIASFERIKKLIKTEEGSNRKSDLRKIPLLGNNNVLNDKYASILVFLPSKSDIYRLKSLIETYSNNLIALPLHSSLSKEDQGLMYKSYDKRKIILSTNIAETSITIPDVVFVIDTGRVKKKISCNGALEYVVDFISKSSAIQRSGRAGRTCPGVCYRIYSGPNFSKFKDFDDPQILCEPLDETILDLLSLGITNIFNYPFINRPSDEILSETLENLRKLGIIDEDYKVTKIGKLISKLPLAPRVAKLLCIPNTTDIIYELIDLVSCLSAQIEIKRASNNKIFFDTEKSDLLVLLKIYRKYLKENDKILFLKDMNLNFSTFMEIEKISKCIRKKLNVSLYETNDLSEEISDKLRKIIFFCYSDHLCISNGSSYFFKNQKVFPSTDSIKVEESFLIFDFLVRGKSKTYMKNITVVDKEWFT